jgi:hypothetical protein
VDVVVVVDVVVDVFETHCATAQPETWVTFQTGDMGNSFSLLG